MKLKVYKKREPEITAFKYGDKQPQWFTDMILSGRVSEFEKHAEMKTDVGFSHIEKGDYIVREEVSPGEFVIKWMDPKEFITQFEEVK